MRGRGAPKYKQRKVYKMLWKNFKSRTVYKNEQTIRENSQCEVWEVAKKHIWEIKKLGLFHPSKCQGSVECITIITISSTKYV